MTDKTCETCRWWQNQTCKRYPPANVQPSKGYGTQPRTGYDDWCGEYQLTTPSALDELIASTADQYGDIEP